MPEILSLAFVGLGASRQPNTDALLNDWLQPELLDTDTDTDTEYDFFLTLPLTERTWTAGMASVLEWAEENRLAYNVVTDASVEEDKEAREIAKYASMQDPVANETDEALVDQLFKLMEDQGGTPTIVVLIDPNTALEDIDPITVMAIQLAERRGIPVKNLSLGLLDTKLSDFESPEPPKPEPKRRAVKELATEERELTDETPPPARRKRRTKAEMDAARVSTAPVQKEPEGDPERLPTQKELAAKIQSIKDQKEQELQASLQLAKKVRYEEPSILELLAQISKRLDELEAKVFNA
jgi:hypothetical protein